MVFKYVSKILVFYLNVTRTPLDFKYDEEKVFSSGSRQLQYSKLVTWTLVLWVRC